MVITSITFSYDFKTTLKRKTCWRDEPNLASEKGDDEDGGETKLNHEVVDEHGVVDAQLVLVKQILQVLETESLLWTGACKAKVCTQMKKDE